MEEKPKKFYQTLLVCMLLEALVRKVDILGNFIIIPLPKMLHLSLLTFKNAP